MNRIKKLRKQNNWTQDELGNMIKVQKSAVSKYENGSIALTDEMILNLSQIFNVSTDYLLGRTDEQKEIRPSIELDERINNLAKENSNIHKLIDFFSQLDPSKQQTLIDLAEAYIAKQNQDKKQ